MGNISAVSGADYVASDFSAPSSTAAAVVLLTCPPPAEERCLGFNRTTGAPVCGVGYDAAAPACVSCQAGYYPTPAGACLPCGAGLNTASPGQRLWTALRPLLIAAGAAAALAALMLALVLLVLRRWGGTLRGGAQRTVQFTLSTILVVQTIAQVASTLKSAPSLPPVLAAVLEVAAAFQLESSAAPHPRCTNLPPFLWTYLLYAVAGAALAALAASLACSGGDGGGACSSRCARALQRRLSRASLRRLTLSVALGRREAPAAGASAAAAGAAASSPAKSARGSSRVRACCAAAFALLLPLAWLRRHGRTLLFVTVSILYSVVASAAFRSLRCRTIPATLASYSALDGDGATLLEPDNAGLGCTGSPGAVTCPANVTAAPLATAPLFYVSVLAENPGHVCWEGSHRTLAALSLAALAVMVLGFPAATAAWVCRRLRARRAASAAAVTMGLLRVPDAARNRPVSGKRPFSSSSSSGSGGRAASGPASSAAAAAAAETHASRRLSWSRIGAARTGAASSAPVDGSPASNTRPCARSSRAPHPLRLDADPFIVGDARLGFFVRGALRPSRWWWRHVELGVTAGLAAAATFFEPGTAGSLICVTAILAASTAALLVARPYTSLVRWNYPVRLLATTVASLALACAYVAAPTGDGVTPPPPALAPLAYACFVAALLLVLALLMGFLTVVLRGAVIERMLLEAAKRRRWQGGAGRLAPHGTDTLEAYLHLEMARAASLRLVFKSPFSLTPMGADGASPVAALLSTSSRPAEGSTAAPGTPAAPERASFAPARGSVNSVQYVNNTLLNTRVLPLSAAHAAPTTSSGGTSELPLAEKQQPPTPRVPLFAANGGSSTQPVPRPRSFSLLQNPLGVRRPGVLAGGAGANPSGFGGPKRRVSKATFGPTLARDSEDAATTTPGSTGPPVSLPRGLSTAAAAQYMSRMVTAVKLSSQGGGLHGGR